jgi:hypothetical protein
MRGGVRKREKNKLKRGEISRSEASHKQHQMEKNAWTTVAATFQKDIAMEDKVKEVMAVMMKQIKEASVMNQDMKNTVEMLQIENKEMKNEIAVLSSQVVTSLERVEVSMQQYHKKKVQTVAHDESNIDDDDNKDILLPTEYDGSTDGEDEDIEDKDGSDEEDQTSPGKNEGAVEDHSEEETELQDDPPTSSKPKRKKPKLVRGRDRKTNPKKNDVKKKPKKDKPKSRGKGAGK